MKHFLFILLPGAVSWQVRGESALESAVLAAVQAAHFEKVIDFGAGNESCPVTAK